MTSNTMSQELPPLATYHRMPDALMIGSAKSATTLLTQWLSQHPSVGMGGVPEPNFFSHPDQFARGLDWYTELFQEVRDDQLVIDSSTGYTRWPQFPLAASRIAHYVPQSKLIYLMRHPVERAYSHYLHRWTKECHPGEPFRKTFEQYVLEDPMCIDGSNYQAQIQQYLDHFPAEQLLCLFTFDVRDDPVAVLQEICRFLEIDDDPAPFSQRPTQDNRASEFLESRVRVKVTDRIKKIPGVRHVLPSVPQSIRERLYQLLRRSTVGRTTAGQFKAPPLSPEVRRRLIGELAESTQWVAQFTGRDLSCWNE